MLVVVVIVQFEFKFHFINLPQPPASREASAALSRSLSRCSLPHSCTALHALSDICLLAPAACDCVRHSPTAFSALLCMHSLIAVRFICLRRLVRLTLTQPSGCLRLSLSSLSLCRCLRRVRHRLRGHRCWRRRHRQSFTNFQCERARHLFTVYSARFVRCCCCVCVCRIKCVVLEVCACVYVYLPHLLTTPPPPVPPRQIRPRRSRRLL